MSNIDVSEGCASRYEANAGVPVRAALSRKQKVQSIAYGGLVFAAFLFVAGVIFGVFP